MSGTPRAERVASEKTHHKSANRFAHRAWPTSSCKASRRTRVAAPVAKNGMIAATSRIGREPILSTPRILLIDDDPALLAALSLTLEDARFVVTTAGDGAEGLACYQRQACDLIISDINMPVLDGFQLCLRLRQDKDAVPILLLTSRDGEIDEALGLELGADDYIAKPFSSRILIARVRALLRRSAARLRAHAAPPPTTAGAAELAIYADELRICFRGSELALTVTEFRLLQILSEDAGRVYSRERLLDLLRDDGSVVAVRIIDTYIRRLRRKLEAIDAGFQQLETVIGAGYRWRK